VAYSGCSQYERLLVAMLLDTSLLWCGQLVSGVGRKRRQEVPTSDE